MNYEPHAVWLQLFLLIVPVITFGFWPLLRSLNGAPVLLFARINILSQFSLACIYALIFEGPQQIQEVFEDLDIRVAALVLGGFLLGHGDQLGAIPMIYLQPGTTNALVGTTSLVLTCIFNYIQVGAKRPDYVFSGLFCALAALFVLSQTVKKSSLKKLNEEILLPKEQDYSGLISDEEDEEVKPIGDSLAKGYGAISLPKTTTVVLSAGSSSNGLSSPGTGVAGSAFLSDANDANKTAPQPKLTISKRKGFAIMAPAGLCTAAWGPLSTYARNGSSSTILSAPGLMVFFFTLGEVLALPDLYLICLCIEPQPEYTLTWRRLLWGVATGVGVVTGYFFFFTSTYYDLADIVLPATVIVYCNPLVAVLTDIARGEFNGAGVKTKLLLISALILYIAAVLLNAFSTA